MRAFDKPFVGSAGLQPIRPGHHQRGPVRHVKHRRMGADRGILDLHRIEGLDEQDLVSGCRGGSVG